MGSERPPETLADIIAGYQIIPLPRRDGDAPLHKFDPKTGEPRQKIGSIPIVSIAWFICLVRWRANSDVPYTVRMGNPQGYPSPAEAYADLGKVIQETWGR